MSTLLVTNPPWNPYTNLSDLKEKMRTCEMTKELPMRDYLESQGKTARFKGTVSALEANLSNLPTKFAFKLYQPHTSGPYKGITPYPAFAEEFASNLNDFLFTKGMETSCIPPTLVKIFNSSEDTSRAGSLSYFVESRRDLYKEGVYEEVMSHIDTTSKANASALLTILAQYDIHRGNWLAAEDDHQTIHSVLIDTEGLSHYSIDDSTYGKRPWVSAQRAKRDMPSFQGDLYLQDITTEEELVSLIPKCFDFEPKEINYLYTHLCVAKPKNRILKGHNNRLFIRYFQDDSYAFPIAPTQLPEKTIEAYKALRLDDLCQLAEGLIQNYPKEFDPRKESRFIEAIDKRRRTMLSKVSPMPLRSI